MFCSFAKYKSQTIIINGYISALVLSGSCRKTENILHNFLSTCCWSTDYLKRPSFHFIILCSHYNGPSTNYKVQITHCNTDTNLKWYRTCCCGFWNKLQAPLSERKALQTRETDLSITPLESRTATSMSKFQNFVPCQSALDRHFQFQSLESAQCHDQLTKAANVVCCVYFW